MEVENEKDSLSWDDDLNSNEEAESLFENEAQSEPESSLDSQSVEAFKSEEVENSSARGGLMKWDEALTLEGQIEAILFAAPKPMLASDVAEVLQDDGQAVLITQIEAVIDSLVKLYKERNGGFRLEHDKGLGFQFRTVPAAAPLMEKMFSARQRSLSRAALETLAIIAYRQPVTRADIEYIRGVDAGSIIKNLLERELIACVGRKEDAGRPMMFGTTNEFLKVFRLSALQDLPPLSAFQPVPDTVAEALLRLEDRAESVDVDEFMADPDQEKPAVSEGLTMSVEEDDFTALEDQIQVRQGAVQSESTGNRPMGALFDAEGLDGDGREDDSSSEMVVSVRDSLPPRGGEDDFGGTD